MPSRLVNIKKRIKEDDKLYYKNLEYPSIPVSADDLYIISKSTDRLVLNPGLQIRIPMNIREIYDNFDKINI